VPPEAGRLQRAARIRPQPFPARSPAAIIGRRCRAGGRGRAHQEEEGWHGGPGRAEGAPAGPAGRGHAHLDFERAIADRPAEPRGARPPGLPHSPWRLVEHLRIARWDILRFSVDPDHVSPGFPEGYRPEGDAPPDPGAWDRSVAAFRADLRAMIDLVADPETDLFAPISHGQGQTVLRVALLVADHNAYHLGQLVTVRRLLGAWQDHG
jgi:DinB superfamily